MSEDHERLDPGDTSEATTPDPSAGANAGAGRDTGSSTGLDAKLAGLLCYAFGFVSGVVFLVVEKRNRDVRFHAYQSTLAFGFLFALSVVSSWVPGIGWLVGVLIWPFSFILWLLLMWKAFEGERFKLPVAGEWAAEQADQAELS